MLRVSFLIWFIPFLDLVELRLLGVYLVGLRFINEFLLLNCRCNKFLKLVNS